MMGPGGLCLLWNLRKIETLNTGWTFIITGKSNSKALALTALVAQNGLTKRGYIFPGGYLNER